MSNEKLEIACWNEVPESDTFCVQPYNMVDWLLSNVSGHLVINGAKQRTSSKSLCPQFNSP